MMKERPIDAQPPNPPPKKRKKERKKDVVASHVATNKLRSKSCENTM
jgi:hypothetical protein